MRLSHRCRAIRLFPRALLVFAYVCACLRVAIAEAPRTVQSLDQGWRFHLGESPEAVSIDFNDSTWRSVDVPHDYVIEGGFEATNPFPKADPTPDHGWFWLHGFLPVQAAVYRRTLDLPSSAKGARLWLEFDGVFNNARYWLNGREIGRQYSGYTRARFDITDAAHYGGSNVLVVQVDPRYEGWWYEGGGIYRHVRLVTVTPVHIAPDGIFVAPTVSDPGDGIKADASIVTNTDLTNTGSASVNVRVSSEIVDGSGRLVATASSTCELGVSSGMRVLQTIPLTQALLWSPGTPHLYHLRSTVSVGDAVVDEVTTTFGVRHVRFDAERGLFLNGKALKLQGVNLHQDHAGVGVAVPDRLFTWRLERLKEVGCNAIRLSHNPVSPFLLDECDRLGFVVIAENRNLGDGYIDQTPKDAKAEKHRDLSALVMRDRNHPSILLWSLCNEQWIQATPESAAMARAMRQRVLELDPTRPVSAALNGGFDAPSGLGGALDLIGLNYHPDVYDSVHAVFPKAPLIATEIASEIGTRGVYATDRWHDEMGTYFGDHQRGYVSAYSITAGPAGQTVENAWPPVASRPFVAGGFVWAGFDYMGEPRPFGWPVVVCHYGFMDLCGFPKDSYYYYKSWWTQDPVLHLFPHWNWSGKEGQEIPVWVHSNCEWVELFLNGVSQGKQTVTPLHHLEWKVRYASGTLVARGERNGRMVETVVGTTGSPAGLRLTPNRSDLSADGADLSVIKVEIVDAQGRMVPNASNRVHFSLSGPARVLGVGNGDPSCHEPAKASERSAFNGLVQVLVQTTASAGEIALIAEAEGLPAVRVRLESH
jgi:beta-galactosidase